MTGRPALIRQRDVTLILKGAAAAGVALGIVVKNGEVHFLPIDEIRSAKPIDDDDQYWAKWTARRARRRAAQEGAKP